MLGETKLVSPSLIPTLRTQLPVLNERQSGFVAGGREPAQEGGPCMQWTPQQALPKQTCHVQQSHCETNFKSIVNDVKAAGNRS